MFVLAFAESIQLFPDATLFVHIGLILLMIWILNRTLFRPVNRVIEQREKNKGGRGGEALAILEEVGKKEARVSGELLDARAQGYEIVSGEQKKAAEARDEKIAEVKAETVGLYESGRAEIEQRAAATHAEISTDANRLADQIAASILKA